MGGGEEGLGRGGGVRANCLKIMFLLELRFSKRPPPPA